MDKFGIFKLLNSFYDFYEKNKNASSDDETNVKEQSSPSEKKVNSAPLQVKNSPLQSSMINTINSHDEFVRRVLKSNKEKK